MTVLQATTVRYQGRKLHLQIGAYLKNTQAVSSTNKAQCHWRHQLWGTGARAPLELGHVKKFGSFYDNNKH